MSLDLEVEHYGSRIAALEAEVERLLRLMPPTAGHHDPGVGAGSWSVFAEKVVAERDRLLEGLREHRDYMREQVGQCCSYEVYVVGCHECAWMRAVVRRLDALLDSKGGE
jgi:hypothetical protein